MGLSLLCVLSQNYQSIFEEYLFKYTEANCLKNGIQNLVNGS